MKRIFSNIVKSVCIIILSSVFTYCTNNNQEHPSEESCFCDSIYYNRNEDTSKEVLCYKGEDVFKLKLQQSNEILSKHKLSSPNYLCERLVNINGKNNQAESYCLSLKQKDTSVNITLSGPNIDSLSLILTDNNNQKIASYSTLGNNINLSFTLFSNSSLMATFVGYEIRQMQLPNSTQKGDVITYHKIIYPSLKELYKCPLDTVLTRFKKCLR